MFLFILLDLLDSEEDKQKFEKLYYKYKDLVFWVALKYTENKGLAEDICQETFLSLALNFKKVRKIEGKDTKAYIATIATNVSKNKLKKERKRLSFTRDEFDEGELIDDNFFETVNILELREAINSLPEEEKTCLYLRYVFGYNSKEIGEMLNLKSANVRKRLQFAKEKVRKFLGGESR